MGAPEASPSARAAGCSRSWLWRRSGSGAPAARPAAGEAARCRAAACILCS